ncbi:MAG: TonB-dependent receptor [Bryobacterales bacterium]|nr:TonB-dependent receptor [Bryobacterales bacterium]
MSAILLSCIAGTTRLAAQTAETAILGTVTDPAGGVVAGAVVKATQPETGVSRETVSNSEGLYEIRYLRPGDYVLEFRAAGFRAERRTGIVLQINQQARFDVKLQVGEVIETVEVSASAPLLQTETAVVGDVIAQQRIVNLPLNNRNFLQLSIMTPGVRIKEESNGERTRVVANGNRDIWMQVNINGITAVNNRAPFVNFYPSVDAIQEFKVQSSNYSAEYGGQSGANINVQLRGGTNEFHGSVFEFLRNDAIDARGYFAPAPRPKPVLRRNQFGGVIAGPVQKNKLFMMAGYEGVREKRHSASTAIVMPLAMRRGDFSEAAVPVIDPLNRQPFANNMIPASRLNPVSVNLINAYMPPPNQGGSQNFAGVTQDDLTIDQLLTRADYYLTAKDQVTFHYVYSRRDFPSVSINPVFYQADRTFPNQSLGIQHVHTFSPSLLNEFRFGFHRGHIRRIGPRTGTGFRIEDLGINGMLVGGPDGRPLRDDEQGFPTINIEGYLGMGEIAASSNIDNSRTYQWVDNVSVIRGRHALKFGGDVRYHLDEATTNNWPFGQLQFNRDIAGLGAAAYMLGFPRETLTPEGVPLSDVSNWRFGLYAQDDWKATSRLTLNVGLRWDYFTLPRENNHVTRFLSFGLDGPLRLVPDDPSTFLQPYLPEYNYWGPRFGLAYRISERTVFRAGYGIFRTAAQFDNMNILQLNPPAGGSLTVRNELVDAAGNPVAPVATIQNPVPRELYPDKPIFNVVTVPMDRKRRNAYVQNYNATIAHQITGNDLIEVGWVASKSSNVDTSLRNFNQPEPGPGPVQERRPYPDFATIRMMVSDGNGLYHSLQSRYEHRLSNGLNATAAYTWGHMIDDITETINRGGCGCQSARRRGAYERGDSVEDIRHRMIIGGVWEIPWGRQWRGVGGAVLGGWQGGWLLTFESGQPFTVSQSGDTQNKGGNEASRPHTLGVNANLPGGSRDPSRWFDTAAFVRSTYQGAPASNGLFIPGSGGYGTAGRNVLRGPGVNAWDLSVSKNFRMPWKEGHSLTFRTEFFNAFNRPQFAEPGNTLGTGSFGVISSTRGLNPNRQMQFALKYMF